MGRPRQRRAPNDAPRRWWTAPRAALLASALLLLLTVDDRHAGRLSDEAQVAWSAVALVETGSLELAPDARLSTLARAPDGGHVSKYGLGGSLVQLPAALLAPSVERRLGPGASRPLFLVAPLLLVVAAAWIASRLALALGGSEKAAALAVLLAVLASPLGSYSSAPGRPPAAPSSASRSSPRRFSSSPPRPSPSLSWRRTRLDDSAPGSRRPPPDSPQSPARGRGSR